MVKLETPRVCKQIQVAGDLFKPRLFTLFQDEDHSIHSKLFSYIRAGTSSGNRGGLSHRRGLQVTRTFVHRLRQNDSHPL